MGTLKLRKRFDDAHSAAQTRDWFLHPAFHIPGIEVRAEVVEIGGEIWLYLVQSGSIVTDDVPILPDYERVS